MRRWFAWACAATLALLATLAVLRHVDFHAKLLDLGVFHQALWNTSRLRLFASTVRPPSYLGDHFSPSLALLAPLEWLPWPVAALLVAQAAAVVSTALSVEALARRRAGPDASAW